MVTEYSPYRVMAEQEYPPGVCFVTGTPNGPFIDTGIYIPKERFGQLVLSRDFIAQAAREMGLFADTEDKIQRAYDIGFAEGVKEEISSGLDRYIDQLGLAVDVLRSIRDAGVAGVEVDAESGEAAGAEDAAGTGEGDSGASIAAAAGAADGQGAGAPVDEGPDRVPAGASDGEPFRV